MDYQDFKKIMENPNYAPAARAPAPASDTSPRNAGQSKLSTKLEAVSDRALDKLVEIMALPLTNVDPAFTSVLRSQTTAAGVALNTQVRVDEVALRKQEHDRLPELLKFAEKIRAKLPPRPLPARRSDDADNAAVGVGEAGANPKA